MDQPEKEYFGPTNYEPIQPASARAPIMTAPEVEYKKDNLSQKIKKSVIDFLFTFPFMVIYIKYAPKLLIDFIPNLSEKFSLLVSGLLFMVIIGVIYFTWGEHWPVGRKKIGFALMSLTMIVISVLQISTTTEISDTITITEEGVFNFKLGPFEAVNKWIDVKEPLRYSTSTPGQQIVYIKYKDGGQITKVDAENVRIKKGTFKYIAGELPVSVTLMVVKNKEETK